MSSEWFPLFYTNPKCAPVYKYMCFKCCLGPCPVKPMPALSYGQLHDKKVDWQSCKKKCFWLVIFLYFCSLLSTISAYDCKNFQYGILLNHQNEFYLCKDCRLYKKCKIVCSYNLCSSLNDNYLASIVYC